MSQSLNVARIGFVCALILLPLSTTACAVGSGTSSSAGTKAHQAARTPAGWSAPASIRGVRALNAVSCPTQSFCVAVGGRTAVSYLGGPWSSPRTVDARASANDGLATISCASPTFCVAGDRAGRVVRLIGTSWSAPAAVDEAGFTQISCASPSFCGAVDQSGEVLLFNGSTWSRPETLVSGPQLEAITCTAASFCMAVDGAGTDAYAFAGGRWRDTGSLDVSTPQGGSEPDNLSAVACSGPDFCAALDDFGDAFTWSGGQWSGGFRFDANLADETDAVSCPSSSFCMLLDTDGVSSAWNGASWSHPRSIDTDKAYPTDVSCATESFCIAADTRGRALSYRTAP